MPDKKRTSTTEPSDEELATAQKVRDYDRRQFGVPTVNISYANGKYLVRYEYNDAEGNPVDSRTHVFARRDEAFEFAASFDLDDPASFEKAQNEKLD